MKLKPTAYYFDGRGYRYQIVNDQGHVMGGGNAPNLERAKADAKLVRASIISRWKLEHESNRNSL